MECQCAKCIPEANERIDGMPVRFSFMIVCPICGNKRCPKAADHRNECTNSNEPGQVGSLYENA
jgi:hypothetical protein